MNRFERPDLYHADCMEALKEFPDQFFDLAIVDPPYGIGVMSMNYTKGGVPRVRTGNDHSVAKRRDYRRFSDWDVRPGREYFDELFRVSKKQIIWGGNYFSDMLPPSKGFIIWDKRCADNMKNDFADCEYAWMSAGLGVARIFRFLIPGYVNTAERLLYHMISISRRHYGHCQ